MKLCVMLALLCAYAWADAFNEGQMLFSGNKNVDSFESTEIPTWGVLRSPPKVLGLEIYC